MKRVSGAFRNAYETALTGNAFRRGLTGDRVTSTKTFLPSVAKGADDTAWGWCSWECDCGRRHRWEVSVCHCGSPQAEGRKGY